MKKLISLLLAVSLVMSLGACGKDNTDDSSGAAESKAAAGTDEASEDGEADPKDEGEEPAETEAPKEDEPEEIEVKDVSEHVGVWEELDQETITLDMGMGWNLRNQLEASPGGTPNETAWGNPTITYELLHFVKEQGFSTVRVPVSYLDYIGEGPDYTIDEEWLDRVQEVVDYVIANDLYAVVNMHGDGYTTVPGGWLFCGDEDQEEIKDKYGKVWTQIAERFKDYDQHLIFESMNEEFDGTWGDPDPVAYQNINDYNQIFVDSVRGTGSNNAKRWLLVPGWNTNVNYTVGDWGFEIPKDELCEADGNRLMISVHFYDPYGFCQDENKRSQKSQWGKYSERRKNDNWGQEDYVDEQMQMLNDAFVSKGYPVIIGEMGVIDRSEDYEYHTEFRRYWLEYVVSAAKKQGIVPVYWDNGWNGNKGFGLINRADLELTQPTLIEAMIRAINAEGDYEIAAPEGFEDNAAA